MKKFTTAEAVKVLTPEEQGKISDGLHKVGKTSAKNLTDEERKVALDSTPTVW